MSRSFQQTNGAEHGDHLSTRDTFILLITTNDFFPGNTTTKYAFQNNDASVCHLSWRQNQRDRRFARYSSTIPDGVPPTFARDCWKDSEVEGVAGGGKRSRGSCTYEAAAEAAKEGAKGVQGHWVEERDIYEYLKHA
jgi:hypothetical protein